jgi:hypothetical protein
MKEPDMDENDLREDRDLWKQSEETCSRQYDKLLAEHSALRQHAERLAAALERAIPHLENYLLDAQENGHPEWIRIAQDALNDARSALPKDGA